MVQNWRRIPIKMKNFIKGIIIHFMTEDASKMCGRVFDLRKKAKVELEGFDIFVMKNDYIGRLIYYSKQYEPHVTKSIRKLLKKDDVFLDVGGNIGYFTMLGSSIVDKNGGKVIVIEPNPQNLQLIFSSIAHNRYKNVKVYPLAVSDEAAILKFTTVGSNGGVVTKHSSDQKFTYWVQSVKLDEILINEPRLDLVKIDIEAHEPFALRGMKETIMRLRPKIITEFHPWAMEINNTESPIEYLKLLETYGYSLSIIVSPSGELIKNQSADEVIQYWKSLGAETIHLDLLCIPD